MPAKLVRPLQVLCSFVTRACSKGDKLVWQSLAEYPYGILGKPAKHALVLGVAKKPATPQSAKRLPNANAREAKERKMNKETCPITRRLCNRNDEDEWCAWSEDGECRVLFALEALSRIGDAVEYKTPADASLNIGGHLNTYEQN